MQSKQLNTLKLIHSGGQNLTLAHQSDTCCPRVPGEELKSLIHGVYMSLVVGLKF